MGKSWVGFGLKLIHLSLALFSIKIRNGNKGFALCQKIYHSQICSWKHFIRFWTLDGTETKVNNWTNRWFVDWLIDWLVGGWFWCIPILGYWAQRHILSSHRLLLKGFYDHLCIIQLITDDDFRSGFSIGNYPWYVLEMAIANQLRFCYFLPQDGHLFL